MKNKIKISPNNECNTEQQHFQVIWKDLEYRVSRGFAFNNQKTIVNKISGYFRSGQIMAVMGPSGCGKSSLLGCLSGTYKNGITGNITISTKQKIKLSFISQEDYLDNKLLIKESLIYASQLKNGNHTDHKSVVNEVMDKLNIKNCTDKTPDRCSGGQRKRISIALELVSRPNILILDEPTSGLDTVTTWQLVNTLIKLTREEQPLAVVATIHQPSAKLFNLFDSIYIMSFDGQCIYQGIPRNLVKYLKNYSLKCPPFHNPSDFVLEVATREHGIGKLIQLSSKMRFDASNLRPYDKQIELFHKFRTMSHIWILTKRTILITIRDPFMLPIRVVGHILITTLLVQLWGSNSGYLSGCSDNFSIKSDGNFIKNFEQVLNKLQENTAFIYFWLLFIWFGSIFAVLLTFPMEMNLLLKEIRNGWYSGFSYYLSKVIVDLLFQITIPVWASIPAFIYTGQYFEQNWRLYYFVLVSFLTALAASSQGLLIGSWLMDWPGPVAFIGVVSAFPMVMFSGFMISVKNMPVHFRWISAIDFMRYGFESAVITVYGFDRCSTQLIGNTTHWTDLIPDNVLEQLYVTNKVDLPALMSAMDIFSGQVNSRTESIVMLQYGYIDNNLYYSLGFLILILVLFKILTYFIILRKI